MRFDSMPSRSMVSQADQSHIENAQVPRSKFINAWSRKGSYAAGQIYPIMIDEVLPGDHLSYKVTAYLRLSTPLYPLFDNQRVDTHFFFVPCRLVWDNWERFNGAQDNPGDSIAYTIPQCVLNPAGFTTAFALFVDHFGLPQIATQLTSQLSVNTLPFRCYNLIWNAWFRDENLNTSLNVAKGNGPDPYTDFEIRKRAKSHDYFTSALPWPQKFVAPTVPIGGLAPIVGLGINQAAWTNVTGTPASFYETGNISPVSYAKYNEDGLALTTPAVGTSQWAMRISDTNSTPAIYADLAATTGVAINTLRQAWLVQQLLERDARGGSRYVEKIRAHFGVISPDFRLDRPEYIGGGQSPLNITPVAQTSPTAGLTVGALGAAGVAAGTHSASYAATEHGYIIGLLSVRSELSYQQGLHKLWSRLTQYDFYVPSLAGLGEQAILTKEIYATGVSAADAVVFGYQERWQEYRTRYSDVVGTMRSTSAGTIDMWHLAQKFTAPPVLNASFISDLPPMIRVLAAGAASTNQEYLADILYQRTAVRPIPTFGTPVTLGRF